MHPVLLVASEAELGTLLLSRPSRRVAILSRTPVDGTGRAAPACRGPLAACALHRMSHTAAWKLPLRPTHRATKDCSLKRAAEKSAAHVHVPASGVPPLRHGHNAGLLLVGEPGWRALVAPLPSRHHLSLLPSRSELLVRAASPGVLRVKGPEGGGQALDVAVALDEGAEGRHAVAHKVVG